MDSSGGVGGGCNLKHVPRMTNMQQFLATVHTNNNNNNNNNNKNSLQTFKMQTLNLNDASELAGTSSPPDFDFSVPCRYFKSTFARSLSLNNANNNGSSSNQCKSLDFDVNIQQQKSNNNNTAAAAVKNACPPLVQRPRSIVGTTPVSINLGIAKNEVSCCDVVKPSSSTPPPPAIPARRAMPANGLDPKQAPPQTLPLLTQFGHTAAVGITSGNGNFNKVFSQQQQQQQNYNNNNNSNFRRNIVWPRENTEQDCVETTTTTTSHAPTNRHAAAANAATLEQRAQAFDVQENTPNVEAVILQNQVDTLQWQLKQVETSCVMYRAVMEEVARFLDRYQCQKQQQRLQQQKRHSMEQIARSKSLYHVYGGGIDTNPSGDEAGIPAAYLRARSSTNLIDLKQQLAANAKSNTIAHNYNDALAPANSYSAFKDFTWRRSPKKPTNSRPQTPTDDVEEKLNQEAFRLTRTIHNLLNTSMQQPDLTHHRNSMSSLGFGCLSNKTPSASTMTLHAPMHNSTILSNVDNSAATLTTNAITPKNNNTHVATEILFLRAANMRDSRLSLRSSTDSSVHSTTSSAASSSSKVETDEETTTAPFHLPALMASKQMQPLGSTTEDESGFSSISSFQDVGVPLSSTLISTAPTTNGQQQINSKESLSNSMLIDANLDSRNSTLKAPPPNFDAATHPNNVLGVPLNATHDMQHRWDTSSAKTYRNANKLQRFSTLSNEDSATVLWV